MVAIEDQIFNCANENRPFLLNGGAGSGKTHTLITLVNSIYERTPKARIACITYTNAAVEEIKDRALYKTLKVATIHDFLWSHIGKYNKELKEALTSLYEEEKIRSSSFDPESESFITSKIQYRDYRSLNNGIVSHDEVIPLAEHLFEKYKLLCDVFKDSYDYLFIDEYQDTFNSVVEIFLTHLNKSSKELAIGFFGDSMQSIYANRVGSLDTYITEGKVVEIQKPDNARNPEPVIEIANKLRFDSLEQKPVAELWAKNYGVAGSCTFLYSLQDGFDFDNYIPISPFLEDFDFENAEENKALYLTVALIAQRDGFSSLDRLYDKDPCIATVRKLLKKFPDISLEMTLREAIDYAKENANARFLTSITNFLDNEGEIYELGKDFTLEHLGSYYLNRDNMFGESRTKIQGSTGAGKRRDPICQQLYEISHCIELYKANLYNAFIKKVDYTVSSIESKRILKEYIEILDSMSNESCIDLVDKADEIGIWTKSDKYLEYEKSKPYLAERMRQISYREYQQVYRYVEEYSIFSSQHGIKGKEYDNVLVVMDNGGWNNYSFEKMFLEFDNPRDEQSRNAVRARHIFYVCCTRPKKRLVIYYENPSDEVLSIAKEIFGGANVQEIS